MVGLPSGLPDTNREDGSAGAYLPSCKDPEGYHQHYQTPTGKMVGKMVATPSATPSGLPSGLPGTGYILYNVYTLYTL
jgi:hypothetical protein